jgi:glutaredoxin|tara:strand:+ start:1418 stop:1705 length:288 start_codon:yes stop_codon:yes gene_type:complete
LGNDHLNEQINKERMKATVYTGLACIWCERVKTLLKDNGYEIEEIMVNQDILKELEIKTGEVIRTVPQVVIDNVLVGGYQETEELMVGAASINKV